MPSRQLTVGEAFEALQSDLKLSWAHGQGSESRLLTRDLAPADRPRLLGPLNFNSSNRIQLLGAAEVRLFGESDELDAGRFEYSLSQTCDMFVVSDNLAPPPCLVSLANSEKIALLVTPLEYSQLHNRMRFLLVQLLAEKEIIHGVMMDVHGTGVLTTIVERLFRSQRIGHPQYSADVWPRSYPNPENTSLHCSPQTCQCKRIQRRRCLNCRRSHQ